MQPLTKLSVIHDIMERYGFHFSKQLGQNFIINPAVCPKIAQLGVRPGQSVLEIGTGFGVLTRELAAVAGDLTAVEIDSALLPVLKETLADFDNVQIIHADFMQLDLKELFAKQFPNGEVAVCANLPYYITSLILMRLLEEDLPICRITVMVQKEAAVRLCAPPGSKECGGISAAVFNRAIPKKLFDVSRGSFYPAPKVDSAVISLEMRPKPLVPPEKEDGFFKLVKAAFAQRRKTLPNTLAAGLDLEKEQIVSALAQLGLPPTTRGEQLTFDQLQQLAELLLP